MLETLALALSLTIVPQAAQSAAPSLPPETQKVIEATEPVPESRRVQADDIDELLASGNVLLLDVREPRELEELGTLEGYVNIPLGQLEDRLAELPKDKAILTA
jgi:hypothetical protein